MSDPVPDSYERSLSREVRKAGGIYYTPRFVVDYIVHQTLGPLLEAGATELRILDPACGCGAFLVAVCDYLRQHHVNASVYGVDLDPQAVQIARRLTACQAQVVAANILLEEPFAPGFDVVLGNPPYRRELNYKSLLDEVARTPFGRRYRAPRMDLWYYFAHRGLELLKPSGVLAFIVNSYWTSSSGAAKLIAELRDRAHLDEIYSLGSEPVFPGVSGRHMILRVSRTPSGEPTILKLADPPHTFLKSKAALFTPSGLDLEPDTGLLPRGAPLGEFGVVRQGIAENPASINRRTNLKFGERYRVGDGVFVLKPEEAEGLPAELLRPYHGLADIGRYRLDQPSHTLIYSTHQTCIDLASFPTLAAHLEPFRPVMEARRETVNGANRWWHLHWPRDEKIWLAPKILAPQMVARPAFVPSQLPTYVPFSVNVFVPHMRTREHLYYLTALLNSSVLWEWFRHHAKKRGISLEINGHVLAQAPIRLAPGARHDRLVELVAKMLQTQDERIDREIDTLVREIYSPSAT